MKTKFEENHYNGHKSAHLLYKLTHVDTDENHTFIMSGFCAA